MEDLQAIETLFEMIESSLFGRSIYFNYNMDLTIKIKGKNILKSLELEVKLYHLKMLSGSYPAITSIRIYYKILNTLGRIGTIN